MTQGQEGGCLCGRTRYATGADPLWVTVCYCRFCQQATGSDRMIEPIYDRAGFAFSGEAPAVYTLVSQGSGKEVYVHFCPDCGTKLALTFARWPDRLGIYIGTLDDPNAIALTPDNAKQIFVSEARAGTVLMAGLPTFDRHAAENDGTPLTPVIHATPVTVGG